MASEEQGPGLERPARSPTLQPLPAAATSQSRFVAGRDETGHGLSAAGIADLLSGQRAWMLLGGIGLLVVAAVVLGLVSFDGSSKNPGPQQQSGVVAGASMIRPVPAAEVEKAVGLLMMSDADKSKVRAELARGKLRIGWITVSDTMDEDGDWVRIAAGGLQQDVRLFNKPYTMAVPYVPGMPVSVIGLIDGGGGGITVAVYVGSAKLSLKPMQKGETLQIPTP